MAEQRHRKRTWTTDNEALVKRALDFASDDEAGRSGELDLSIQRYAKFRQWRDADNDPLWEDSADTAQSDLMALSLREQDTLHNSVMTTRPAMESKAVTKADGKKQDNVDLILDYQLLEENGPTWLSDIIEHFTNDGHFTALMVWVDESRKVTETMEVDPIPPGVLPGEHFRRVLAQRFQEATVTPARKLLNSWDWTIVSQEAPDTEIFASFYTIKDGTLELDLSRQVPRFQGPKVIPKQRSQVLAPVAVENLQMPGPSNPRGAPHVILVDRPTILEIKQLKASGFYEDLTDEDITTLEATDTWDEDPVEQQKSIIAGETELPSQGPEDHRRVTRFLVMDVMDTGTGEPEDVVYWVLKETKMLARKRRLFEAFPSRVPRRPLAEAQRIPVPGRRTGIGILEQAEGIHDLRKLLRDQVVNLGSLLLSPFFFYRPTSGMNPEVIRNYPGEGYPLNDPKNDVVFPQINAQGISYAMNLDATLNQDEERLSLIGDLNMGRVPAGKASALRTTGNMAMILGQGDARPERLLRRFFGGLGQVWSQAHELNRHFLDKAKSFRIAVPVEPGEDPYRTVEPADLDATMEFTFSANVMNTSKQALQANLEFMASMYLSEIAFMTKVSDADTVYALLRDIGKARGQDPQKYIKPPQGQESITIDEAIATIIDGQLPKGKPMEGPEMHLALLQTFAEGDKFGLLPPESVEVFQAWMQIVQQMLVQQQQLLAQAQAAGRLDAGGGGQAAPGGTSVDQSPPQLQPNELADETLPSSGGGAPIA